MARAESSGVHLSAADAALIKGMLARGDRQHDIAAWFGVNGGRIAEIAVGRTFKDVPAGEEDHLPPPGPYLSGKDTFVALKALSIAKEELAKAEALLAKHGSL